MKKLALLYALLFCSVVGLMAQDARVIPGEYIVKIKATSIKPLIQQVQDISRTDREANFKNSSQLRARLEGQLDEIAKRNGVSRISQKFVDATVAFHLTDIPQDLASRLMKDPDVEAVVPNYQYIIPKLPIEFPKISTQQTPCAITSAGGFVDGSAKPTWIWILDTGIDTDHPDLNVQTSPTFARSFIAGETV